MLRIADLAGQLEYVAQPPVFATLNLYNKRILVVTDRCRNNVVLQDFFWPLPKNNAGLDIVPKGLKERSDLILIVKFSWFRWKE